MKKLTKLILTLPISIAMLSTPYQTSLAKENIANNKSNIKLLNLKILKILYINQLIIVHLV